MVQFLCSLYRDEYMYAYLRKKVISFFPFVLSQNSGRILRGLFEITLKKGFPALAAHMLELCKCVDHRLWMFEHPLKQFAGDNKLTPDILRHLEAKGASITRLKDLDNNEIGTAC